MKCLQAIMNLHSWQSVVIINVDMYLYILSILYVGSYLIKHVPKYSLEYYTVSTFLVKINIGI